MQNFQTDSYPHSAEKKSHTTKNPNISTNSKNYEMAISIRFNFICNILNAFIQKAYQKKLRTPQLNTNPQKEDLHFTYYNVLGNTIHTDLSSINITLSDIGTTLAIAHEFGHVLRSSLSLVCTREEEEEISDIFAGFVLQKLHQEDLLDVNDLEYALNSFEYFGEICDLSSIRNKKKNIHGSGKIRKQRIQKGYNMNDTMLKKYLDRFPLFDIDGFFQFTKSKVQSTLTDL